MKFSLITKFLTAILVLFFTLDLAIAQQNVPFETYMMVAPDPEQSEADPDWVAYCISKDYDFGFGPAIRTGTANYLGKYTSVEWGCLDFSLFPIVQAGNIIQTFTAANGDELETLAEGVFDFSNPPEMEGVWEIIGGTGRFENATGGGQVLDIGTGESGEVLHMVGTISFNASDRRRHRGD
jgi:hypothetical protein